MTLGHVSPAARSRTATALGLALGFGLDQLLGDPRRFHPVAGFGTLAARVERRSYADRRAAGVLHVGLLVGASAGLGAALAATTHRRTLLRLLVTTAATWTVLGGRSLQREAQI